MGSLRVYFCDICILMLVGINYFLLAEVVPVSIAPFEDRKGNCSCGGFPTVTPDPGSLPLLSQTPSLVVKCDQEGDNTCKILCNALATATKAKGPEILCSRLKDVNELKLSAFYKTCDKPWSYANMTAEAPLCCENSQVKVCSSVVTLKSTVQPEAKTTI
ncbi:uncharacterized protein LOC114241617 [Bombyx mandarina]|uniref:Uncharacterized protein n=2 Tax=Bombyx TaxID=7090 RepID=A0A8R1WIB6_BOMMO|nr:uncharacterized protein LOC101741564 [Bombyx mori]XP_028028283.1 uncharacterized protein LOC114241617 [Bombyx mandarina]